MLEQLSFNGIDGASGTYLTPSLSAEQLSQLIMGSPQDAALQDELKAWHAWRSNDHYAPMEGTDPLKLEETGWGVIFAHGIDPAIVEALRPLLDFRKKQATALDERLYREFRGETGYRPGESKRAFLARAGAGFGPVDPRKVPYYLLLVGDPDAIPFSFQYQLDVQYAVGRIHFDTLDAYDNYARSVVLAETGGIKLPRKAVFFGVQNPDDGATNLSAPMLVAPVSSYLMNDQKWWEIENIMGENATKARLQEILGGDNTPTFLFSASHGMGFPKGDVRQLPHQGALLCQDWPGPKKWRQPIPQDFYFAGDDISSSANLHGLLSFHFACYGAGTPRQDEFSAMAFRDERIEIAPHNFLAQLPTRLLGHARGGALAVVGHVERAWDFSFRSSKTEAQVAVFQSALKRLLEGHPVGSALDYFNVRYAELACDLAVELEDAKYGKQLDPFDIASLWTANNDARSYIIVGDPAVRLPVAPIGKSGQARPVWANQMASLELRSIEPEGGMQGELEPSENPAAAPASEFAAGAGAGEAAFLREAPADLDLDKNAVLERSELGLVKRQEPEPGKPNHSDSDPSQGSDLPEIGAEFGLRESLDPIFTEAKTRLSNALKAFTVKIGTVVERGVESIAAVQTATYVAEDLRTVSVDPKTGRFTGGELRALTRVSLTGETQVCVPMKQGEVDQQVWQIHMAMLDRAQQQRIETLKTLVSLASSLINPLQSK